ncbi:MAG: FAD:protein FMN transferase [Gemmatimonadales bacterium]
MESTESSSGSHLSRRELILLGIGAFALFAAPFARRGKQRLVRRRLPMMGTVAEIGVVDPDPRRAQGAIDAAFGELARVERLMTRFTHSSDVGRANLEAAQSPVRVAHETATVLAEAVAWAAATDGEFDPCVGKAVELWDVSHRDRPPPQAAIKRLAGRHLYRGLELDTWRGAPVVRFRDPEIALDLGGIAKGYGVDRAVSALRKWGIRDGLVNVGGDLYALGESEDGDPWRVGVRSPTDPDRLAGRIEVRDRAVATSGDYMQYFRYGNRRYHHLLDPATGAPRMSGVHSVTAVAESCITADAAATAVFGMDEERANALLAARAPAARIVSLL